MKILITGGAGFIGSHVAEALQNGHEVVIIDDLNDYYDPKFKRQNLNRLDKCKFYQADVTDYPKLQGIFAQENFDLIIHLAARAGVRPSIQQPELYARVNLMGTTHLLKLAAERQVPRIIFGSTSAVYGNTKNIPFIETENVNQPISPYAASKLGAEMMLHTFHTLHGIQTTILRFFTVYGERGRPDMAPYLFSKLILEGKKIKKFGDGKTSRDYTYIADIVQGVTAAVERPFDYEIINLGNRQPVSLNDFIATIENAAGKKAVIEQVGEQPGDVQQTYADISKAQELLDFQPATSLGEGMEKFITWFKANRL